jgi:hypothetical protein
MNDINVKPAEQPANLTTLQRELLDLATRTRLVDRSPHDRLRNAQGPILVIRGK